MFASLSPILDVYDHVLMTPIKSDSFTNLSVTSKKKNMMSGVINHGIFSSQHPYLVCNLLALRSLHPFAFFKMLLILV